jgi:hypothetical protein
MRPLINKFRYAFILCLGAGTVFARLGLEGEKQPILKAGTQPVIDGQMDDIWYNAMEHILTLNGMAPPDDASDLFGSWRMLWDEENLYLFCSILDDSVADESPVSYEQDGIEFYFDADNSKLPDCYDGVDDILIRINHLYRTWQDITFFCGMAGEWDDPFDPSLLSFAIRTPGGGWQMEVQIPGEIIHMDMESGRDFGFEMQVNDNDAVFREHILKWWSADQTTWINPSIWGTCTLSGLAVTEILPVMLVNSIQVDGIRDPAWEGAPVFSCNHWIEDSGFNLQDITDWSDIRFQFQTAWDLEKFYCYARVFDDAIQDFHPNVWEQDGLEFFFDGDNSKLPQAWDNINDISFWINHGFHQNSDIRFNWGLPWVDWGFDKESIVFGIQDTEDGYAVEFSVPLDELQIEREPGTLIGFDIKQNDNDSGERREGMRQWWGETNNSWYDASLFGTAVLVGEGGMPDVAKVSLIVPDGPEIWLSGSSQKIVWSSVGVDSVLLEFSRDGGGTWELIQAGFPASQGSCDWTIPQADSDTCLVRIRDKSRPEISDASARPFTITTTKGIILISPDGGEDWYAGTSRKIRWSSTGVRQVNLEYSTDGGNQWMVIIYGIEASASEYLWYVPDIFSNNCRVRVSESGNAGISDTSAEPFGIVRNGIRLLSPNGGEVLISGDSTEISWEYFGIQLVNLWISYDRGYNWEIIANSTPCTGTYAWKVPYVATRQGMIRIENSSDAYTYNDASDSNFTIKTEFVTAQDKAGRMPLVFELSQNHPNPFNPETRIPYTVPVSSEVSLDIYNIEGRWIRTLSEGFHAAGRFDALWDGRDASGSIMSAGIYLCRMEARPLSDGATGFSQTKKIFLIK